jgi:uncharacterized protein YecE (DUF72 family)
MANVFIGTSGWTYPSWESVFYPANLPHGQYLNFYSQHFLATEVNYSFYRLPGLTTIENWTSQVPKEFCFALKASRFITHVRRLKNVESAWRRFLSSAAALGRHRGPILLQFPENFHADAAKLADFLIMANETMNTQTRFRLAFEFRHESWFSQEIFNLLLAQGAALCIADSPCYPRHDVITTDFTYYRFHGRVELFASSYSSEDLAAEARKIRRLLRKGIDVYAFFNNDAEAHAVQNAAVLRQSLRERMPQ